MAAPTYKASGGTNGFTPFDFTLPTHSSGDLMLVGVNCGQHDVSTPSGWTKLSVADTGSFVKVEVFWKVSDGTETAFHVALTDATGNGVVAVGLVTSAATVGTESANQSTVSASSWAQPTVTVDPATRVVHFTAQQLGGPMLDLGADVTVRQNVSDGGTVYLAAGDWVPGVTGTETVETAHTSSSAALWAGITVPLEGAVTPTTPRRRPLIRSQAVARSVM